MKNIKSSAKLFVHLYFTDTFIIKFSALMWLISFIITALVISDLKYSTQIIGMKNLSFLFISFTILNTTPFLSKNIFLSRFVLSSQKSRSIFTKIFPIITFIKGILISAVLLAGSYMVCSYKNYDISILNDVLILCTYMLIIFQISGSLFCLNKPSVYFTVVTFIWLLSAVLVCNDSILIKLQQFEFNEVALIFIISCMTAVICSFIISEKCYNKRNI